MSRAREHRTRKTTAVALGLSAAVHAAAFAWLAFPIQPLETGPRRTHDVGPAPDVKLVVLREEAAPAVTTDAAATPAGGAGTPGRAESPLTGTPAAASPVSAPGESPVVLAAADTLRKFDVAPIAAAAVTPVAVAGPVAADAGAAAPAPAHVPGSAASAKGGRGAGSSQGSGGIGVSAGHGGITIKIGGGRKRHPPRGMPGRGRW